MPVKPVGIQLGTGGFGRNNGEGKMRRKGRIYTLEYGDDVVMLAKTERKRDEQYDRETGKIFR